MSYILVSNVRKNKTLCTSILLTLTFIHIHKNIHFYIYPTCFDFFVFFSHELFLGKCKSSSLFFFFKSIFFPIALTFFYFYRNVKKMLNKRNINSVCLLRKDLLSDKVSTEGPPTVLTHMHAHTHSHTMPPSPDRFSRSSFRGQALRHTQTIQILSQ